MLPPDSTSAAPGYIILFDHDVHAYITHSVFTFDAGTITEEGRTKMLCTAEIVERDTLKPWRETNKIVDKV